MRCADYSVVEMAPARVAAARAALAPYPWRRLTPQMMVRRVLATVDGAVCPSWTVAPDDPRIDPLLAVVSGVQWRALSVDALCRLLLAALDDWRVRDVFLDLELIWLLDEGV